MSQVFREAVKNKDVKTLQASKNISDELFEENVYNFFLYNKNPENIKFFLTNNLLPEKFFNHHYILLNSDILSVLLENESKNKFNPNSVNGRGMTLLHYIVPQIITDDRIEMIKLLIDSRIDVNLKDYRGETALDKLIKNGNEDDIIKAKLLIDAGAIINPSFINSLKNDVKVLPPDFAKYRIPLLEFLETYSIQRKKLIDEDLDELLIKDLRKMVLEFF